MAKTPMTAMPIRKLSPLEQGDVLLGGQGPYAMQQAQQQQALMAQQAQQQEEPPPSPEDQMLEQLKTEKDGLTKTNKVKELALAIEAEMHKQAELDQRMAQSPGASKLLEILLNKYGLK